MSKKPNHSLLCFPFERDVVIKNYSDNNIFKNEVIHLINLSTTIWE